MKVMYFYFSYDENSDEKKVYTDQELYILEKILRKEEGYEN